MAGYMTVLTHNVYNGRLANGAAAAVKNGTLMVMGTDGKTLVLPEADTNTKLVAIEKTTIYDGMPAVVFNCDTLAKTYYFVQNVSDHNDSAAYDSREVETAVGELLNAHPLHEGEEFVVAMDPAGVTVGTAYGVLATGLVG